jgi:hypothetical protein
MNDRQRAALSLRPFIEQGQLLAGAIGRGDVNGHELAKLCREAIAQMPQKVVWHPLASAVDKQDTMEATEHFLTGLAKMAETVQAAQDRNIEYRKAAGNN